jgi:hypothetical protein
MYSTSNHLDLDSLALRVANHIRVEIVDHNQITNKITVRTIFPEWLSIQYDSETQLKVRSIIKPHLSSIIQQKIFEEENKK